jgi:AGZA family xanthine/uracil permease-like MFS transporter
MEEGALRHAGRGDDGVDAQSLEKKFLYAAIASTVGAVLSFIGLIHAPEVAWAANPQVALGYLFFGIVCVGYGFLPGAKDPVEVDEADIVAGH